MLLHALERFVHPAWVLCLFLLLVKDPESLASPSGTGGSREGSPAADSAAIEVGSTKVASELPVLDGGRDGCCVLTRLGTSPAEASEPAPALFLVPAVRVSSIGCCCAEESPGCTESGEVC